MAKVATRKAEKIERSTASKKLSTWREALGGGCDKEGNQRSPTAFAYRWTKGLCGWISSPVGDDIQESTMFLEEPDEENEAVEDWSKAIDLLSVVQAQKGSGSIAPASDQVSLEKEAADWASLWETQKEYKNQFSAEALEKKATLMHRPCAR